MFESEHPQGPEQGLHELQLAHLLGPTSELESELEYRQDAIGIGDFEVARWAL